MKKKICGVISVALIIILLCSGIISELFRFFLWLFALQCSQPETSVVGGIIVRVLTFVVSFSLVGIIFDALGFFNKKIMSVIYFVVSTVIGFVFAYIVWKVEQHILIIGIIMGVIAALSVAFVVTSLVLHRRKRKQKQQ